ncbi:MAG: YeaH/YhbH family protein, partial [Burkholderiales bacterium]|nr:YeaH/YhbH family protein [Burkholderiales bacterium]
MQLIDRRLNGNNKSAVNRERFLRRYKEHIRGAVKGMIAERSIADMEKGGEVTVPAKDLAEPSFRHDKGGDRETVFPGNHEFVKGDKIARPNGGGGGG